MRCDLCGKHIRDGECVSGYKHGEVDNLLDVFVPNRDAAWVVICKACSEKVYRIVFSSLNPEISKPRRYQIHR